jgi:hypothetical protein
MDRAGGRAGRPGPRLPWWVALAAFLAIAAFLLWEEHRAHILGALPYLLVLACLLIHLFLHRGHGHGPFRGRSAEHEHPGPKDPRGSAE